VIAEPTLRAMADVVAAGPQGHRPILVPLRSGHRDRLAVYLVPGGGGSLAAVHRFVYLLAPGRRIAGFEAPGLYPGEAKLERVSDLARRYVAELEAAEAEADGAPYALVGTSFGGFVVHEMASRLEQQGRPPTVVVMFDCIAPGSAPPARQEHRTPRRAVRAAVGRLVRGGPPADTLGGRIERTQLASRAAIREHRPSTISAPAVLFTSDAHRARSGDPLLGWRPYLRGPTEVHDFDGRHTDLIRENAPRTAPVLDAVLARFDP
jgi:thioesterase domain-containing protein